MGVFPAGSKQHVPPTWQELMTDPKSPIIDFYPINFKIDLNGKKYAWQGTKIIILHLYSIQFIYDSFYYKTSW